MNEIKEDKKEEPEEKDEIKKDEDWNLNTKAIEAYYPLIKLIIEEFDVTPENFEEKIKHYIATKNLPYLETIIMELLINLNPPKRKF